MGNTPNRAQSPVKPSKGVKPPPTGAETPPSRGVLVICPLENKPVLIPLFGVNPPALFSSEKNSPMYNPPPPKQGGNPPVYLVTKIACTMAQ